MKILYAFLFIIVAFLAAIANNLTPASPPGIMKDGYYTAESAEYDNGWKEFLSIYVKNGRIVTAEYDAKNASGFIKSWDMEYMRKMNETDGTYPNQYTRGYVFELINRQNVDGIDAISGATHSYYSFIALAEAVIARAKTGDKRVALVPAL
ncbi:MAG: FMN-binding protein [Synergistaceae bacterium]|jgi:major membrane immunogen (membrane-anchored lipoprotein)|nr:FMN-binding protein [Synergistaceae bacterium]